MRIIFIALMLAMATCGIGLPGNFFSGNKDGPMNRETRIERVDRKDENDPE